jgi:hypothetical protein
VDLRYYLQFGVALLGLLGGLFAYILGLRIRHDIFENNEHIDKKINAVKDNTAAALNALRQEITKEFGNNIIRQDDKSDRLEKDLSDIAASFTDKILHVVNGKYVRTDLYITQVGAIQDRFVLMKELIESNMKKIEDGLDRQIVDLKDRIFHDK